jgi:hypothetical protein
VNRIRTATAAVLLASFVGVAPAPAFAGDQGRGRGHQKDRWEDRHDRREVRDAYNQGYWDATRHYRQDDRRYKPRRLGKNDRIYRGSDNRYYCKRDDGTSGLIIGGLGGGALGNIIAPGGSKVLGTLIGGAAGAIIGQQIDKGDVVCR